MGASPVGSKGIQKHNCTLEMGSPRKAVIMKHDSMFKVCTRFPKRQNRMDGTKLGMSPYASPRPKNDLPWCERTDLHLAKVNYMQLLLHTPSF